MQGIHCGISLSSQGFLVNFWEISDSERIQTLRVHGPTKSNQILAGLDT